MLFQVKTIALITSIMLIWGPTPGLSRIQYGTDLIPVIAPPDPSMGSPRSDTATFSYLALGDSYTIGESVPIADRYPVQAVRLLRAGHLTFQDPEIIATTGWTTGNLIDALKAYTAPYSHTIVTLLIGVNNQYQGRSQSEYRDQFTSLLQQSIALAGNKASHVVVLSIPDYSVTPFARGLNIAAIASQIDSFNAINQQISRDLGVHYLDITGESRKAAADTSLIATDGLHFSGKEYSIWAALLTPVMQKAASGE
jgi:lysophospholipase L1-like esterase